MLPPSTRFSIFHHIPALYTFARTSTYTHSLSQYLLLCPTNFSLPFIGKYILRLLPLPSKTWWLSIHGVMKLCCCWRLNSMFSWVHSHTRTHFNSSDSDTEPFLQLLLDGRVVVTRSEELGPSLFTMRFYTRRSKRKTGKGNCCGWKLMSRESWPLSHRSHVPYQFNVSLALFTLWLFGFRFDCTFTLKLSGCHFHSVTGR